MLVHCSHRLVHSLVLYRHFSRCLCGAVLGVSCGKRRKRTLTTVVCVLYGRSVSPSDPGSEEFLDSSCIQGLDDRQQTFQTKTKRTALLCRIPDRTEESSLTPGDYATDVTRPPLNNRPAVNHVYRSTPLCQAYIAPLPLVTVSIRRRILYSDRTLRRRTPVSLVK